MNITLMTQLTFFVCGGNTLRKLQVYNTLLLTTVTLLYIRSSEFIHLKGLKLCILDHSISVSPPPPTLNYFKNVL